MISVRKNIRSFRYAFNGLFVFFRSENNAKIHGLAAIFVIGMAAFLGLTLSEWLWVSVAIALVLATELLNSAIEQLGNAITMEKNEAIGKAKDMGAAAVFIAMLFALVVAGVVLLPKLILLLVPAA
jgi:diacylglycerol kinase